MSRPDPITELINQLAELPGIGQKTATRLAFHILHAEESYAQALADAVVDVKTRVRLCEVCCNFTESSPCRLCASAKRDRSVICVVESPQDVSAIEATGEYQGLYHILHGVIAPLDGVGPDDIKLNELIRRVGVSGGDPAPSEETQDSREADDAEAVREVIVATNPSVEGEATALYVKKLLRPLGIEVSRIASGLPMGSHLEYADKATLGRSIADRRPL